MSAASRAAGAALGLLADRAFGEPPDDVHPVAAFGRLMGGVETRTYGDDLGHGALYAATGVSVGLAAGTIVRSTAVAVGLATAGRMLGETATTIADALTAGDLDRARDRLPGLVGRDPAGLDAAGIARAVIESVAENTVDAVVAPVLWGAVAGAPGAGAHRAVNTMDAMVGHRTERYRRFGTAAARLDDAMAWVPARATAGLVALVRPRAAREVAAVVRRDAGRHPSPNAGVAEAAFAAALGLRLGGPTPYRSGVEDRPVLGHGRDPRAGDVARAVRLSHDVGLALAGVLAATAVGLDRR